MITLIILITILNCVYSLPNPNKSNEIEDSKSTWRNCTTGVLSPTCVKISAIALLEKLNTKEELQLFPGIALVKETEKKDKSADIAAELLKTLPNTEERLDKYLIYRFGNYLDTHSVKLKLLDNGVVEEARGMYGEARKKDPLGIGGKKGGMGTVIAMAMMMKGTAMIETIPVAKLGHGTLMSIGLGGLAMLAGKAMMTAMMSLLLSAIIGLKSLTSGGKSTTYEIVSKPIYSHSHSHSTAHEDAGAYGGHSGYGRNLNTRRR